MKNYQFSQFQIFEQTKQNILDQIMIKIPLQEQQNLNIYTQIMFKELFFDLMRKVSVLEEKLQQSKSMLVKQIKQQQPNNNNNQPTNNNNPTITNNIYNQSINNPANDQSINNTIQTKQQQQQSQSMQNSLIQPLKIKISIQQSNSNGLQNSRNESIIKKLQHDLKLNKLKKFIQHSQIINQQKITKQIDIQHSQIGNVKEQQKQLMKQQILKDVNLNQQQQKQKNPVQFQQFLTKFNVQIDQIEGSQTRKNKILTINKIYQLIQQYPWLIKQIRFKQQFYYLDFSELSKQFKNMALVQSKPLKQKHLILHKKLQQFINLSLEENGIDNIDPILFIHFDQAIFLFDSFIIKGLLTIKWRGLALIRLSLNNAWYHSIKHHLVQNYLMQFLLLSDSYSNDITQLQIQIDLCFLFNSYLQDISKIKFKSQLYLKVSYITVQNVYYLIQQKFKSPQNIYICFHIGNNEYSQNIQLKELQQTENYKFFFSKCYLELRMDKLSSKFGALQQQYYFYKEKPIYGFDLSELQNYYSLQKNGTFTLRLFSKSNFEELFTYLYWKEVQQLQISSQIHSISNQNFITMNESITNLKILRIKNDNCDIIYSLQSQHLSKFLKLQKLCLDIRQYYFQNYEEQTQQQQQKKLQYYAFRATQILTTLQLIYNINSSIKEIFNNFQIQIKHTDKKQQNNSLLVSSFKSFQQLKKFYKQNNTYLSIYDQQ